MKEEIPVALLHPHDKPGRRHNPLLIGEETSRLGVQGHSARKWWNQD
jgi:hypothetical protein